MGYNLKSPAGDSSPSRGENFVRIEAKPRSKRIALFKYCILAILGLGYLGYRNYDQFSQKVLPGGVSSPHTEPISSSGCKNQIGADTQSADSFDWSSITPSEKLQYVPCFDGFQCTRLLVPLDYSEPDGEKAAIAIAKWPAKVDPTSEAYRGPILFNPGGPGGSGVGLILNRNSTIALQTIIGDEFDLIGFDPRGIGNTTPLFSAFTSLPEASGWTLQEIFDANSSSNAIGRIYAQSQIVSTLAFNNAIKAGQHMSTAVVSRDMLSIVRAHGRDKLLYWGFSYGTVLGATYAAMFPDNIERLIIDGVVDTPNYYSTLWDNNLRDTDAELQFIYEACVKAGPKACALYDESADRIVTRINNLIKKLDNSPITWRNDAGEYGLYSGSEVRLIIFLTLYNPYLASAMVFEGLAALEKGNPDVLVKSGMTREDIYERGLQCSCPAPTASTVGALGKALSGVACGEGDPVADNAEELAAYFQNLGKASDFAGLWTIHAGCIDWKIRAKEIFNGPFVGNTSYPLLLIGNTLDPVTPVFNAHKVSKGFKDSVVLTQNSAGHCSISSVSLCTLRHIRAYFRDGTLPPKDTVCEIESILFGSLDGSGSTKSVKFKEGVNLVDDNGEDAVSGVDGTVNTLTAEARAFLRAGAALQEADLVVRHV